MKLGSTLEDAVDPSRPKVASPDPLNLLQRLHASDHERYRSVLRTRARRVLGVLLLVIVAVGVFVWLIQRDVVAETGIFQGVTYTCERLPDTEESGGLVHLVRVDLNAPGIELYTTPVDPSVTFPEWEYRLKTPRAILKENGLAVVINGAPFSSDSASWKWNGKEWPIRWSGDLAKSNEIVISYHQANTAERDNFLLWFDDALVPHLEPEKRPSSELLSRAKWGIGSQRILVYGGEIQGELETDVDTRTVIGVDADQKILWLAVFEKASPRTVAAALIEQGVKDAVLVDGGSSSAMALGSQSRGIRPGMITGGWIPVATHFGVRAKPIGNE